MSKRLPRNLRPIIERLREIGDPARSDRPPILLLQEIVEEFGNPGAAIAHIAARGETTALRETAVVLLFLTGGDPEVPAAVRRQITTSARPILLDALRDPSVSDDTKFTVGPLHDLCGGELDHDEYAACFVDFAGTCARLEKERIVEIEDSLREIEGLLEAAHLVRHDAPPSPKRKDFEGALALASRIVEAKSPAAPTLLATVLAIMIERGEKALLAEAAGPIVDFLERLATGRSAWLLGTLGSLPATGALGEDAARRARSLGERGVRPEAPRSGSFTHGFASGVDGAGNRNVTLFFRTDAGELDALALLLGEQIGVKDAWAVFGNAAGMDAEIRARSGEAVTYAPCGIELARRLLADAYATHAERGVPAPGRILLYAAMLGAEPITPRRHAPNLGAYALETFIREPGLVKGSAALGECERYAGQWFSSDAAYAYVKKSVRQRYARAEAVPDAAVDSFLAAVGPLERPLLARRIAATLEIESLAGRARERENVAAARVWLAIGEGVVPFASIPYVRGLARHAIVAIGRNLASGHRNQQEANEASLGAPEDLLSLFGA